MASNSLLATLGRDVKGVWSFITSNKGQTVVGIGETAVESFFPASAGIFEILNSGLREALKIEALAVAANQASNGGAKLADLVATLTPQILAYAAANKFPIPEASKIQSIANYLVAAINELDGSTSTSNIGVNTTQFLNNPTGETKNLTFGTAPLNP